MALPSTRLVAAAQRRHDLSRGLGSACVPSARRGLPEDRGRSSNGVPFRPSAWRIDRRWEVCRSAQQTGVFVRGAICWVSSALPIRSTIPLNNESRTTSPSMVCCAGIFGRRGPGDRLPAPACWRRVNSAQPSRHGRALHGAWTWAPRISWPPLPRASRPPRPGGSR